MFRSVRLVPVVLLASVLALALPAVAGAQAEAAREFSDSGGYSDAIVVAAWTALRAAQEDPQRYGRPDFRRERRRRGYTPEVAECVVHDEYSARTVLAGDLWAASYEWGRCINRVGGGSLADRFIDPYAVGMQRAVGRADAPVRNAVMMEFLRFLFFLETGGRMLPLPE